MRARPRDVASWKSSAAALAAACTIACGAPLDSDAAYHRIQIAEARIAHAGAERAVDCAAICDASASIRDEARALNEPDATTRAERAERTCAACAPSAADSSEPFDDEGSLSGEPTG